MSTSSPIDPGEYLLQQFDAIESYEKGVKASDHKGITPHAVKSWYARGNTFVFSTYPDLLELCQELEKSVPLDHPYWGNFLGAG